MAYCTKCGHELRESDRFCAHCGAPAAPSASSPAQPVQPSQAAPTPSEQPPLNSGYPPFPPQKKPRKGLLAAIVGGSVLAALLLLVLAVSLFRSNRGQPDPLPPPETSLVEETASAPAALPGDQTTVYVPYTNSTVLFSLEYPQDCTLTEPNQNNVRIDDGQGLRIAAEYAFTSQSQSYIYSAADFAAQIDGDPQVLKDWIGSDALELTGSEKTQIAGAEAYTYDFTADLTDGPCLGRLYIFDGHGELGCYTLTTVYPSASEKAPLYAEQCAYVAESLRITGSYMPEGYQLFHSKEGDYSFLLQDDVTGDVEVDGTEASIYPVESVYTKCRLTLDESLYEPREGEPWEILTRRATNLLSGKTTHSNGFTRQDFALGRYEYVGLTAEYTESLTQFLYIDILFEHDGIYWQLSGRFTPEYEEAAYAAISDVLASLRFGDEVGISRAGQAAGTVSDPPPAEQVSVNQAVAALLQELEDEDISRDCEPLISVTDMDGDGNWEFLVSYLEKDDGQFEVEFELWTMQGSRLVEVAEDTLYTQAGGNTGSVGLAKRGDTYYLTLYTSRSQDQTFHRYYRYAPIIPGNEDLEDGNILMESHWLYEDGEVNNGTSKIDGKAVSMTEFEAAQKEFRTFVTLDVQAGPGNSGLSMTWDTARTYDFDSEQDGFRVNMG